MIWRTKLQTLLETNSLFWSPLSDSRSYICETQTFLYPPIFLKQWKFRGLSRSGIYFVRKNQRTFKTTKKRYSYHYMGDWYPVSFPTLLWKREPDKLILPSSPSRHMYLSRFSFLQRRGSYTGCKGGNIYIYSYIHHLTKNDPCVKSIIVESSEFQSS